MGVSVIVEWKLWLTFETIQTDEVMHGYNDVEVEIDKTMSDKGKISPVIFFSDYMTFYLTSPIYPNLIQIAILTILITAISLVITLRANRKY